MSPGRGAVGVVGRATAAVAAVLVAVAGLAACGSGSAAPAASGTSSETSAPAATTTSSPLAPWSFGDGAASPAPTDDGAPAPLETAATAPAGDAAADAAGATPVVGVAPPVDLTAEVPEVDPCTLLQVDEWAAWAEVPIGDASSVPLEHGSACGYLTTADTVRLALAVVPGDEPWLPTDVYSDRVQVGSRSGHWVGRYPVPESSTLTVDLRGGGELVVEISSRGDLDEDALQAGAIDLAGRALDRVVAP